MRYYHLSNEEKILSQLLEDLEYREKYLPMLKGSSFTNPTLYKMIELMEVEAPLVSIAASNETSLIVYAMDLANAFAEREHPLFVAPLPDATPEEQRENLINTLNKEERKLTNSAPFERVYKAFKDLGKQLIDKEDYLNAYNDWKAYVSQQLGDNNETVTTNIHEGTYDET